MRQTTRRAALASLAVVACLACGCVKREVRGETSIYSIEGWVLALMILGGLAAIPLGLLLRRRIARISYGLLIGGPLLLVFVAPSISLDETKVDAEHFESRYGLWFAPNRHNIRFDDLSQIRLTTEVKQGRRGEETHQYLDLTKKSGATERVSLGTVSQVAAPEILQRTGQKGVPIVVPDD